MPELFLFSGLGADERAFAGLDLDGCETHYMQWFPPLDQEALSAYAARMANHIQVESPILVGLSFGGMVAVEVAKRIPGAVVVLISSAKTREEIPYYFRNRCVRSLVRTLSPHGLKKKNPIVPWFFGTSSAQEKRIIAEIMAETDAQFLKWALLQIIQWNNTVAPQRVYHIHGKNDRLLPYRNIQGAIPIAGAGHLMILTHAQRISEIISDIVQQELQQLG